MEPLLVLVEDIKPSLNKSLQGDQHSNKGEYLEERQHATTSEPSRSARTSLDSSVARSRKSVTFEDSTDASSSRRSSTQSPFSSYANLAAAHLHGNALDTAMGTNHRWHSNGKQAGLDHSATSAPEGSLDAAAGDALAALALESLGGGPNAHAPGRGHGPASKGPTAAQRLMGSGGTHMPRGIPSNDALAELMVFSAPLPSLRTRRGNSTSLLADPPTASYPFGMDQEVSAVMSAATTTAMTVPLCGDVAAFFGEACVAKLAAPPRSSGDASQLSARSSIDLLLETPGTPSGCSRQSLDSLRELLAGSVHSSMGGGEGTSTRTSTRTSEESLGRAFQPFPTSRNSLDNFPRPRLPPLPPTQTPLRDLAASSITVVAEPKHRGSHSAAGPSVGALASNLVDRYNSPGDIMPAASTLASKTKQLADMIAAAAITPAPLDADLHDTFGAHAWYCGPVGGDSADGKNRPTSRQPSPRDPNVSAAESAKRRAAAPFPPSPPATSRNLPMSSLTSSSGTLGTSARCTAMLLEPTSVHGQHSVTLHDSACMVPSYDYLRQRQRARREEAKDVVSGGGGYIAEAKRVLSEAMASNTQNEADMCDSSYSGAIGPLLRHLEAVQGDDVRSRAALHTLRLLESNLPNRAIVSGLQGRRILVGTLGTCCALDVREQAVQLLWDIDGAAGKDAAPIFGADDMFVLLSLLKETSDATVASHALHFLRHALELPADERVSLTPTQLSQIAASVVKETCAHKHHLQDAAQYTLGALLGAVLADAHVDLQHVNAAVSALVAALVICSEQGQCQVLLTVLSCLAGRHRLRVAMAHDSVRRPLVQFAQHASDTRLQARALSLVKVLNKEEHVLAAVGQSWYFGAPELPTTTTTLVT